MYPNEDLPPLYIAHVRMIRPEVGMLKHVEPAILSHMECAVPIL